MGRAVGRATGKVWVRIAAMVAVGAAIGAGIVYVKGRQREAAAARLLEEVIGDLGAIEVDVAGRAYIEGMARRFHEEAAREAFDSRGRPTGGVFDVNRYQLVLVDRMIAHARRDGAEEIVGKLEKFKGSARLELVAPG